MNVTSCRVLTEDITKEIALSAFALLFGGSMVASAASPSSLSSPAVSSELGKLPLNFSTHCLPRLSL